MLSSDEDRTTQDSKDPNKMKKRLPGRPSISANAKTISDSVPDISSASAGASTSGLNSTIPVLASSSSSLISVSSVSSVISSRTEHNLSVSKSGDSGILSASSTVTKLNSSGNINNSSSSNSSSVISGNSIVTTTTASSSYPTNTSLPAVTSSTNSHSSSQSSTTSHSSSSSTSLSSSSNTISSSILSSSSLSKPSLISVSSITNSSPGIGTSSGSNSRLKNHSLDTTSSNPPPPTTTSSSDSSAMSSHPKQSSLHSTDLDKDKQRKPRRNGPRTPSGNSNFADTESLVSNEDNSGDIVLNISEEKNLSVVNDKDSDNNKSSMSNKANANITNATHDSSDDGIKLNVSFTPNMSSSQPKTISDPFSPSSADLSGGETAAKRGR